MELELSSSLRLTKEVKTLAGAVEERHRANELTYLVLSFPSLKFRA